MQTELLAPPRPPRRRRAVALILAAALAIGAVVGLAFGIRDLAAHRTGSSLTVVLRAPQGTGADVMGKTRQVLLERLGGEPVAGATVTVAETALDLSIPGSYPDGGTGSPRQDLLDLLTAPDHLEERQVLQDTPAVRSTDRLTACPGACPAAADVECPSPASPGCSDADLADRDVTLVSSDGEDVFRLGPVLVTASDIAGAQATLPPPPPVADVRVPQWSIHFTLTPAATERFATLTAGLIGKRLAIVVDRGVVTAPELQSPITNGQSDISGRFTERQARDLATALSAGQLPVALTTERVTVVPAHRESGTVRLALVVGLVCLASVIALGIVAVRKRSPQRRSG